MIPINEALDIARKTLDPHNLTPSEDRKFGNVIRMLIDKLVEGHDHRETLCMRTPSEIKKEMRSLEVDLQTNGYNDIRYKMALYQHRALRWVLRMTDDL